VRNQIVLETDSFDYIALNGDYGGHVKPFFIAMFEDRHSRFQNCPITFCTIYFIERLYKWSSYNNCISVAI